MLPVLPSKDWLFNKLKAYFTEKAECSWDIFWSWDDMLVIQVVAQNDVLLGAQILTRLQNISISHTSLINYILHTDSSMAHCGQKLKKKYGLHL